MAANAMVLPFLRSFRRPSDWQPQELAEFYRVEAALVQAGLTIECDRGISDEGEPWFAFCRDDGEVIVHIARIDRGYILAGPAYGGIVRGDDIRSLVMNLVARHRLVQTLGRGDDTSNVLMHPAALLVAVVATAFFKMSEAQAAAAADQISTEPSQRSGGVVALSARGSSDLVSVSVDAAHSAMIVAAILAVLDPSLGLIPTADEATALIAADAADHVPVEALAQPTQVALVHQPDIHRPAADAPEALSQPDAETVDAGKPAPVAKLDGPQALALVAVLSDLSTRDLATRHDSDHTTAQALKGPSMTAEVAAIEPAAERPSLVLEVSKSASGLPKVEAAALLVTEGIITRLNVEQISHVEKLPTLLTSLIDAGAHSTFDWHGLNVGTLTQVVQASLTLPTGGTLPATTVAIDTAPATTTAPSHDVDRGDLQDALKAFIAHTPNYGMVTNGSSVVLYDRDALTTNFDHVKSVTWDFADGSSISLVGLTSNLPDFHV